MPNTTVSPPRIIRDTNTFAITEDHGSREIRTSLVLPNLDLDLIQEVLQRSRSQDQSTIGAWPG